MDAGDTVTYTRYKIKCRTQEIDTIEGKWVNLLTRIKVNSDNGNLCIESAFVICGQHLATTGHGSIGKAVMA